MMIEFQGMKYHWSFQKFLLNFIVIVFVISFWMVYISTVAKANTDRKIIEITVHRGDTLWSIAQEVAPEVDPRLMIQQIKNQNHLSQKSVIAGQKLKVEVIRNI